MGASNQKQVMPVKKFKYQRGFYVDHDDWEELYLETTSKPDYVCHKRIVRHKIPKQFEMISTQGVNHDVFNYHTSVPDGTFDQFKDKIQKEGQFIDMTRCVQKGIYNVDECKEQVKDHK
jgi:hypothetical protein